MREGRLVTTFAARKARKKLRNAGAEIYRQASNCPQLNDDGVHLPVAVRQADMQQCFRQPEMRGRTDRQKLRQALHDPQHKRQQVVVQSPSKSKRQYRRKARTTKDTKLHEGNQDSFVQTSCPSW